MTPKSYENIEVELQLVIGENVSYVSELNSDFAFHWPGLRRYTRKYRVKILKDFKVTFSLATTVKFQQDKISVIV